MTTELIPGPLSSSLYRKVVRRASLSDRHNLRVKEYETEAIVWRGGREGGREEQEKETDQENSHPINETVTTVSMDECFSYLTCV